jgi:hypothetical protein
MKKHLFFLLLFLFLFLFQRSKQKDDHITKVTIIPNKLNEKRTISKVHLISRASLLQPTSAVLLVIALLNAKHHLRFVLNRVPYLSKVSKIQLEHIYDGPR